MSAGGTQHQIDEIVRKSRSRKRDLKERTKPTLEELLAAAMKAARSVAKKIIRNPKEVVSWERHPAIKRYALARANGICESCGKAARFFSAKGEPLLECHHIVKVSLNGPDDPRWVAAPHPDCHDAAPPPWCR